MRMETDRSQEVMECDACEEVGQTVPGYRDVSVRAFADYVEPTVEERGTKRVRME
jgi:hypothetical protein